MQSLAILLCDNDYGKTLEPLLESLGKALLERPDLQFEPRVVKLIELAIPYHYTAFQHRYDLSNPGDISKSVTYLQERCKVVFDAEADTAYQTLDHDGGSFHLHIPTGQINSF